MTTTKENCINRIYAEKTVAGEPNTKTDLANGTATSSSEIGPEEPQSDGVGSTVDKNFLKLIADKIVQNLDKVNDSTLSPQRWVWELMQNAKDVPNKFGRVSVEIHLYADRLVFKHNGDCFTIKDITGLVQQVSSKDSANEGEQTGKFGTGFITTHLLSKVIDVEGIVWNPKYKRHQRFNIRLDRSALKSEDMIQGIKETINKLKSLDADNSDIFPIYEGYEGRKEDSFDTSFTYPLKTDDARRSAEVGLNDLVNTLPITMVSLPKIKSVLVENHTNGGKQKYVCYSKMLVKEEDREILESCVSVNEEKKYFLTYKTLKAGSPRVALSMETKIATDGKYELVARDKNQPVLFRDFPLIGSEEFYFPYILNGFEFEPTETRDGILLNSDEVKPKKNRAIIADAIQAVLSFNTWLISQGTRNTYLMASSHRPKPKTNWDDNYALPWINGQMVAWHESLLKQRLIETTNGYVELSQMKLPDYGGREANRKFYEFLADFKIFCLPLREQQDEWANVLSWAKSNKFSKDDFFKELESVGDLSALAKHLDKTEAETYEWLNKLYRFIVEQNDVALSDNYRIVPNQSGKFCFLKDLRTDSARRIPERIKDIAGQLLQKDLRDALMAEGVDASIFTNMRGYNLDNLIHDVNKTIKETTDKKVSVLLGEWERVSKCVYDIIALHTNDDERARKRERMRQFVSHFVDGMSDGKHIDNLPSSLWEEADRFVLSYVPYLINNKAKTLSELGNDFLCYPNKHNDGECIDWINDFNEIINSYDMRIPDSMPIYPNQTGILLPLTKLHYDKGIPSELIDLNVTANDSDWREKLLDRRISGYETLDPLETADIYEGIKDKFASRYTEEQEKYKIAREAITLCPNSQTSASDDIGVVHDFLKKFDEDLPDCHEIENHSGFSWEIFVAYILKEVCDRISTAVNISGLSDVIDENENGVVNYVDSVLDYAINCYGKRYQKYVTDEYGLWINQNGDFCMSGDISKDDNIDEEVKDFANNPIVGVDYRERLLRKGMKCEYFLSSAITTKDILNEINSKIYDYVDVNKRNLQEGNFTKLVAELMIAIKKHPDYSSSLVYFVDNKDKLFVGSIGDEQTLSLFSSIASTPERKELFTQLDKFSNEELQKIVDGEGVVVIGTSDEKPSPKKKRMVEKIAKLSERELEVLTKETDPQKILEDLIEYYGNLPTDTEDEGDLPVARVSGDNSLSEADRREYNDEAKKIALQKLEEDGFDISAARGDYSVVSGVKKGGVEYPLVIKSYRHSGYRFHINPNEWIQLYSSLNSMLLIYTGCEIGKVTFSNLFRNQDNMSLEFSLDALGDTRNVLRFAEILRYFKGCHFDFSNLAVNSYESMSKYGSGQKNPNAFLDLSPDDKNLID